MAIIDCPLRLGADANAALIAMYRALAAGWLPPRHLTEDEYRNVSGERDPADPLTAFVGFGCSYSGKWFGGYARDSAGRNYCANAANSLMKRWRGCSGVRWECGDYEKIPYYENAVVYCDPPYAETTQYGAVGKFDSARFWSFVRELENDNFIVFVSEYSAPRGFEAVLEIPTKLDIRNAAGLKEQRVERLFRWKP